MSARFPSQRLKLLPNNYALSIREVRGCLVHPSQEGQESPEREPLHYHLPHQIGEDKDGGEGKP